MQAIYGNTGNYKLIHTPLRAVRGWDLIVWDVIHN